MTFNDEELGGKGKSQPKVDEEPGKANGLTRSQSGSSRNQPGGEDSTNEKEPLQNNEANLNQSEDNSMLQLNQDKKDGLDLFGFELMNDDEKEVEEKEDHGYDVQSVCLIDSSEIS